MKQSAGGVLLRGLLLGAFLLGSVSVRAQKAQEEGSSFFQLGLGGFYATQKLVRGAVFWPRPFGFAGPSISFWNMLYVRGPSLALRPLAPRGNWRLELATELINDDEPWVNFGKHRTDARNSRGGAWDTAAQLRYHFGPRKNFFVGSKLSKDWFEHKGVYAEAQFGVPVLPFTSFQVLHSWGSARANLWAYGSGAVPGAAHRKLSVVNVIPFLPGGGVLIQSLAWHSILQPENRRGRRVAGDNDNWVYLMVLSYKIL